jgi:hypothetical protein
MRTLTPEEAQEILHVGAFYDMPSLVKYSLAFALFKAAAIVSQLCLIDSIIPKADRDPRYFDSLPYPSYSARRSSPGRRSSPRNVMQMYFFHPDITIRTSLILFLSDPNSCLCVGFLAPVYFL